MERSITDSSLLLHMFPYFKCILFIFTQAFMSNKYLFHENASPLTFHTTICLIPRYLSQGLTRTPPVGVPSFFISLLRYPDIILFRSFCSILLSILLYLLRFGMYAIRGQCSSCFIRMAPSVLLIIFCIVNSQ